MSLLNAFSVHDRPPLCDPFFRWAGSKAPLRDMITQRMPVPIKGNYIEPFLGGGSIAFALLSEPGRIAGAALLSDVNPDLVCTYVCTRDMPEQVIAALQVHIDRSSEDYYHQMRDIIYPLPSLFHDLQGADCDPERAARFLYLLGAGWHGLWRCNQRGMMNTPYGHGDTCYSHPDRIRAASRALSRARISLCDFDQALSLHAGTDNVCFADPPYIPRTVTASFASYAVGGFGVSDHARLDTACKFAAKRGTLCYVSNSDTADTRRIYNGGTPEQVQHSYRIGSPTTGTDPVLELLLRYAPDGAA